MRNKISYLIVFVLFFSQLKAQDDKVYVYIHAGYNIHKYNPKPFNEFVVSYNNYYDKYNVLKSPLTEFKSTLGGISRGFGLWIQQDKMVLGIDFSKTSYNSKAISEFINGRGNEIELEFVDWMVNVDLGGKISKKFALSGIAGTNIRSGVIRVNIIHFDGSLSQGNEFYFNGVYRGGIQADFTLGAQIRYEILPYLDVHAKLIRTIPFFDRKESIQLRTFEDARPGKPLETSVFPQDYELYEENASAGNYDYESNIIPLNFRGWYLQTTLTLKLNVLKY